MCCVLRRLPGPALLVSPRILQGNCRLGRENTVNYSQFNPPASYEPGPGIRALPAKLNENPTLLVSPHGVLRFASLSVSPHGVLHFGVALQPPLYQGARTV